MRVLVAGATGVIGRRLVPLLRKDGHEVVALSRTPHRPPAWDGDGVRLACADALDAAALAREVSRAAPDAVINLLTAIPGKINPLTLSRAFAPTNRLRTQGTRNLLAAAATAGTRKIISESVAFAYQPGGSANAIESDALWDDPPRQFASTMAALGDLERQTADAGGITLRFGHLYGPGTGFAREGHFVTQARKRMMPIVGAGTAVFSFLHTQDAAASVVAALGYEDPGVFNIVDDEPAPVSRWLPHLCEVIGARPPMRLPRALARPVVSAYGIAYMNDLRGADNASAGRRLGWTPSYASWREGFRAELAT